mmetsp:Transcript_28073/g.91764  ORF Transcript_28073/g.91764 Transcript_28073/m.91764 type:complete len:258 (+) Transcript_28073:98-871(+)
MKRVSSLLVCSSSVLTTPSSSPTCASMSSIWRRYGAKASSLSRSACTKVPSPCARSPISAYLSAASVFIFPSTAYSFCVARSSPVSALATCPNMSCMLVCNAARASAGKVALLPLEEAPAPEEAPCFASLRASSSRAAAAVTYSSSASSSARYAASMHALMDSSVSEHCPPLRKWRPAAMRTAASSAPCTASSTASAPCFVTRPFSTCAGRIFSSRCAGASSGWLCHARTLSPRLHASTLAEGDDASSSAPGGSFVT